MTSHQEREQPDFGTYHYSTPRGSERIREKVKLLFTRAFGDLPFSRRGNIKILDAGCGLGFLSCVCAKYYSNESIIGVDVFEHSSLKGATLSYAKANAKILGLADRIRVRKGDILSADFRRGKYDLFVSNLVFHNLGKKRFIAYARLASWMRPESYVLLGDLFFNYRQESRCLSSLFNIVRESSIAPIHGSYKLLVLSQS